MEVVASLAGVVVGGLIIVVADVVRRRSEWRYEQMRRLVDNGVELIATHHRLVGELTEAHEQGAKPPNLHTGSGERYRVGTRFLATPGSEALHDDVENLRVLHRALRDSYYSESGWHDARTKYIDALRGIETRLRSLARDGRIYRIVRRGRFRH